MGLETLKGVKRIGEYDVTGGVSNFSKDRPILIHEEENQLCFKIQSAPVKDVGVDGCQVDTVIEAAKMMLEGMNKKFPCRENSCAITKLEEALHWLSARTRDREKRGVEGSAQA